MAPINSLKRLICCKEWRKHQPCREASSFNYLIEMKQKMLILKEFVTKNVFALIFDNKTEFLMDRSPQVECQLK